MVSISVICILQILITNMVISITLNHCPEGALWHRRAHLFCANLTEYHCLFDTFDEKYIEICLSAIPYKSGLRIVYSGNLDAHDCQISRYSPVHISSNDGAECLYMKSYCNEEGQVAVDNGTPNTDRTCRCDYTNGYDYIKKPKNPCKCIPEKEDCSCYVNTCPGLDRSLNQDYQCVKVTKNISICPTLQKLRDDGIFQSPDNANADGCFLCAERLPYKVDGGSVYVSTALVLFTLCITALCIVGIVRLEKIKSFCCGTKRIREVDHNENTANHFIGDIEKSVGKSTTFEKEEVAAEKKIKNITVIYQENNKEGENTMDVVDYFQQTMQLKLIHEAFEKSGNRLVILQVHGKPCTMKYRKERTRKGPPGSGKTQTSYAFCLDVKNKYSVIAKLMANDASRLTDDLKIFASNLRLELPVKYNSEKLLVEITHFLNLAEHKDLLYLLFIDNLSADRSIQMIKNLLKDVKNVHLILASNDATLHTRFKIKTIIEFDKGLNEEECTNLLRYGGELKISKSEINALTEFITPFPLVINSARLYMIIQKKTVENYIKSFKIRSFEKYKAIDEKDEAYRLHILESQSVPLRDIKSCAVKSDEILWEILMLLPYFQYHSVSSVLLASCLIHKTQIFSEKKGKVDSVIEKFLKYSLCHIVQKCRPKIRFCSNKETEESRTEYDGKVDRFYRFHELTMRALEEVDNEDKNETEIKKCRLSRIKFLLKMFCYEINIDSKSDDVLERNLLFLDHAKGFLTHHQIELLNLDSNEMKCYLSFLKCAIGSTLYFQRTDVELSHQYLISARQICLDIAGDRSCYTRKLCLFLQENEPEELKQVAKPEEIRRVSNSIFDVRISTDTVEEFVLSKRRSRNEMNAIENELENKDIKLFESHYLSKNGYAFLIKKGLAIPSDKVQNIFLHELLQRILHNNGKAFKELYYISEEDTHIRQACYNEFFTSNEFCKLLEEKMPELQMTACLENNRSGRMLKRFSQPNILPGSLEQDITFYEKMFESDFGRYFEFGVMKLSCNSNDRHICTCLRILLRLLYKLYKVEEKEANKLEIYKKGTIMVDKLEKKLIYIEKENRKYMWLSFPVFYIQCGRFLQLSTETSALERGRQLFQKGTHLEESRGVSWTRYMRDGYYGQMTCLKKLERHDDVEKIFDIVKSKLEKTNKVNQLDDFRTLNKDVVI